MRYMLIRKADHHTEDGVMPSEALLKDMADYNERLLHAGVLEGGDGLRPSRDGYRIQFRDGEPTVTDGPFTESRELIAGYTILDVDSPREALDWAMRWPRSDGDGNVTLELRRFFAMEDFDPGPATDQHRALGDQLTRLPTAMNVHVVFPGNCREAMTFYADVTGGSVEAMLTFGETPAAADTPADWHDRIIHASVNLRGRRIMGADMAGDCYTKPQGARIHLEFADPARGEAVFNRLADGGSIVMPWEQTFWAHRFGMVDDRFGIGWMISCEIDHCTDNTGRDAP
ncbi:YciI family protein [Aquisalimonas asiatica]|uniref:Uncharacterized conserved protein n=1 Tax=Aquisalimonas asiatica TaxID=406100 RepID=A0A1H8SVX2_9GAMM|nr:YciI family protein [Aquisalimonas asiatica]SEO82812.1 Uncharacterized conserved protein [Aquisalimonas asiatica]